MGLDRAAREDQLPGHVQGQGPWGPEQSGAGRHHTDPHLGQPEPGGSCGDDEVAGEHDLEATAQGGTLDRRDERLAAPAPDDAVLAAPAGDVVTAGRQVAPGTEHVPRAGQDPRPELVVVVQFVQGRIERVGHGPVDGVALGAALHGDGQHALGAPRHDELTGGVARAHHLHPRSKSLRGGEDTAGHPPASRPGPPTVLFVRPDVGHRGWVGAGSMLRPSTGPGGVLLPHGAEAALRRRVGPSDRASAQVPAMSTTGLLSGLPPMEP